MKEHTYKVKGMHCASCEILIEKKLLGLPGVKSTEASTPMGEVLVEYEGNLNLDRINELFSEDGYRFSENREVVGEGKSTDPTLLIAIVIIIGALFLILNNLGITNLINVNSQSSLLMFFAFGAVAGISSCAALVGGMVLSMSKQWSSEGGMKPHLMFNLGRIISFTVLGAVLGLVGGKLSSSLAGFTPFLVLGISLIMILLAFQMLGIKYFQRFVVTVPKSLTRYIADEKNFKGRYMPIIMGALTFFLPCGFTITTQSIALLSGNPVSGLLIMLAFVLGTTPMLLAIGYSSSKLSASRQWSMIFTKAAGVLVLFFAIFNINSQLNVLGISSINDVGIKQTNASPRDGLPQIVNGNQIIKMTASSTGYSPNYFKVRVGVPVRWEIDDTGTSGCTNAIISRNLFPEQITLTPGQKSIKEFTPTKIGKYKFSCWMGMINGVIEVVEANISPNTSDNVKKNDDSLISSGTSGCGGCGGGNSTSCPMMGGYQNGNN